MKKDVLLFLVLIVVIFEIHITDAAIPITYSCCYDGGFYDESGILLDNFENLSNWTVGRGAGSIDTANFKEGIGGINIITYTMKGVTIDKTINMNFSNVDGFSFWIYIPNVSTFDHMSVYISSNPWASYFSAYTSNSYYRTGWNKVRLTKKTFSSTGEGWNNIMTKMRITIYPKTDNTSATIDDFRYNTTIVKAKEIITIDDGYGSIVTMAEPILVGNDQPAVIFIPSAIIGRNGRINFEDLRRFQYHGWDVSSHTVNHVNLNRANDSELSRQLNDSYDWFINNGLQKTAGIFAYPFGQGFNNNTILQKVKQRYILARATYESWYQQMFTRSYNTEVINSEDVDLYRQQVISGDSKHNSSYIIHSINETINHAGLQILYFHAFNVSTNDTLLEYSISDFQNISNYLKERSSDIDVVTYSDLLIPNINNYTPIINKTTRIFQNGTSILITKNKYDEYMPNMTIKPISGPVDITIDIWHETGDYYKKWKGNSTNNSLYIIGDFPANTPILLKIDGQLYRTYMSNNTGYITFTYSGGESERQFEVQPGINDTTIRNGKTDVPTETQSPYISQAVEKTNDTRKVPGFEIVTVLTTIYIIYTFRRK